MTELRAPHHAILAGRLNEIIKECGKKKSARVFSPRQSIPGFLLSWYGSSAVLCIVLFWTDFFVDANESLARGALMCVSLLLFCAVRMFTLYRSREERYLRMGGIVEALDHLDTVSYSSWEAIRIVDSQIPSLVWCYRNQQWLPVPVNLLIEDETLMVECGSKAPLNVTFEYTDLSGSSRELVFMTGDSIVFPSGAMPEFLLFHRTTLAEGGILVTVKEAILPAQVREYLNESNRVFEHPEPRMMRAERAITVDFVKWTLLVYLVVAFTANCIRYFTRSDGFSWSSLILANPATVILAVLPLTLPLWEEVLEMWGTAKLLTLSDKLQSMKDSVSKVSARVDNEERRDMRLEIGLAAKQEVHVLNVARVFARLVLRVRTDWRKSKYTTESTLSDLLRYPLKHQSLLETLGMTTAFCCLDERTVLAPLPSVEELVLLKGDQKARVLDLYHKLDGRVNFENSDWKDHLSSLKPIALSCLFSARYFKGVTSEATCSTGGYRGVDSASSKEELVSRVSERAICTHLLNLADSVGFGPGDTSNYVACDIFRILDNGSRVEGKFRSPISGRFHSGRAQMTCLVFEEKIHGRQHVHHKSPQDKIRLKHRKSIHSDGYHSNTSGDRRHNKSLEHLDLYVAKKKKRHNKRMEEENMKDRRSLHMFSWGDPSLVTPCCSEYWAGRSIWPLRSEDIDTITSIGQRWQAEDFDGVAFAYTPISNIHSNMFHPPVDSELKPVHIMLDDDASQPSRVDIKSSVVRELISSQVFTGLVGSRDQPRSSVGGLVEDLAAAGIRFVYFSPRNPRRSFVIADKMGLETDWNTAVSLMDASSSSPHEYRVVWDEKAQLPHGIAAIRQHLLDVDDVPLRVSTFTDSKPAAITGMLEILLENGDVVTAVGSSISLDNYFSFKTANLAVVLQSKVLLRGGRLAEAVLRSLEVSAAFNSIHAVLVLQAEASLSVMGDLIGEARLITANYRQSMYFILGMQLTVATIIVLGFLVCTPIVISAFSVMWLVWVQIPLLGLPMISTRQRNFMLNDIPGKLDLSYVKNINAVASRYWKYTTYRLLPTAAVVIMVYMWEICERSGFRPDVCLSSYFWSPSSVVFEDANVWNSQASTMLLVVWFFIVNSITMAHRHASLLTEPPFVFQNWRVTHWFVCAAVSLMIQIGFNCLYVLNKSSPLTWLTELSTFYWCWFAAWPLGIVFISEYTKHDDRKHHAKYVKRLKILFETRLGMYSPK